MPANVESPVHETSDVTFVATAAVTGKRFVGISGDRTGGPGLSTDLKNNYRMAHAAAASKPFGVAAYDVASGATGKAVGTPGRIVMVTAAANISAGAEVEVGANGQAAPYSAGIKAGQCLSAATTGNDAEIKLY